MTGEAGGADPYYGLLERYVEQTTITSDAAAVDAARSRLRSSLPVPVFIDTQEVTISPDAAVEVPLLVPGWCLDITTQMTCRPISQRLKTIGLTADPATPCRVYPPLGTGYFPTTAELRQARWN
ncbi:hypothetical protein ACFY12_08070 [Streptomyces sp. NPDC001339]|uniref:hypothetical protein n=1 Tax=Streptomyces sp. NPDC001339 TaxID=3364563 RepID=UPI00369FA15B